MSEEADPNKEPENKARDFEGRWQASHSSETGNWNFERGKCAEYLLWLELSRELILLPKDNELLELSQEASFLLTPNWRAEGRSGGGAGRRGGVAGRGLRRKKHEILYLSSPNATYYDTLYCPEEIGDVQVHKIRTSHLFHFNNHHHRQVLVAFQLKT